MNDPSKNKESHEQLLESFRAWLHTVITAEQFGQSARLRALPGSKTVNYCASLAKLPDNILAHELAGPVLAILKQIDEAAMDFHRPLYQKKVNDPAIQAEHERILEQLDLALAFILRQLRCIAGFRARFTKSCDLLCDATGVAIGDGWEAAQLIRRYQEVFPEDSRGDDGSLMDGGFPGQFAWNAYQRIETLDRLADEFPEYIRIDARQMHGWPMLAFRHTNNRKRFKELAAKLELGVEYPLDASENARFRPDTPLVRYLDPLVFKIHYVRRVTKDSTYESVEKERESLRQCWWDGQNEPPGDEVVEALRNVPQLPPLTKATAIQWAEKAVVPVIMATNARDWKNCGEPVLQRIAKQAGVKSRATFKSRLLAAVSAALRRLARPK